jgi:threonine dehydrogenase-like Zn-dependent dehydrogenase
VLRRLWLGCGVIGQRRGRRVAAGSIAVLDSYAPALQLIADGTGKVEPLLTHNLPLQAYPDAVEALRRGDGLKIQLALALPDSGLLTVTGDPA